MHPKAQKSHPAFLYPLTSKLFCQETFLYKPYSTPCFYKRLLVLSLAISTALYFLGVYFVFQVSERTGPDPQLSPPHFEGIQAHTVSSLLPLY